MTISFSEAAARRGRQLAVPESAAGGASVPHRGRRFGGPIHFAWVVAGLVFVVLLTGAGIRAAPGVLIVPLEQEFGWSRASISLAIGINIFIFGFIGPFAAAAMQRFGIRRVVVSALLLLCATVALSTLIREEWQLVLTWGVLVGLGSGCMAMVLGATVATRWFTERRGLVMGMLGASLATGQLIFLPLLASVLAWAGWRPAVLILAGAAAAMIPVVFFLLPERPADIGLRPYGASGAEPVDRPNKTGLLAASFGALRRGLRSRDFWLLAGSFFVCGLSTNGLIGTHLIATCIDHGIPEFTGAGLLAVIGIFDLIGTTVSGWLTDKYSSRRLLFAYYGLRGLSLIYLAFSDFSFFGLSIFAVFYGLDWVATLPPTVRLTNDVFGREQGPIMFGWIMAAHQAGAATAAFGAGVVRSALDGYLPAFDVAGALCMMTAFLVLRIGARRHSLAPVSLAALPAKAG
jgi:MFS family permease